MLRKTLLFSLVCTALAAAYSAYAVYGLPDLERFPVHWGADGKPDRYGGRTEVMISLFIMPVALLLTTAILWGLTKMKSMQASFDQSAKILAPVWTATMLSLLAVSLWVTHLMSNPAPVGVDADITGSFRWIIIALALLFIWLGNMMGKVRQNFIFGIRLPWTLMSELSWEKTHRLGGWLFVGVGVVSIIAALIDPLIGLLTFSGLVLVMLIWLSAYSYRIWKSDPNRKNSIKDIL